MRYYVKLLSLPLFLLIIYTTLFIIWKIFALPPTEVLIEKVEIFFESYGLIVFFISALVEGVLFFGGYFPGVFVIFISVISADSLPEALIRVLVGTLGLMTAHIINYFLGKYGWYRLLVRLGLKSSIENAKEKIIKKGSWAIFGSYWLPSIAALADTSAGILQMPFRTFIRISLLASIVWNFAVGFFVYFTGEKILVIATQGEIEDLIFVQLSIVVIWSLILLATDFYKKRKNSKKNLSL